MIWREDCNPYEEQRKKRQYAKDLELQIQYQKQQREQEEREWEELQRKFQPDDQSPAKWIIQGGKVYKDMNGTNPVSYRSAFSAPKVKHCLEPSPILETHEQFKAPDPSDYVGAQDALMSERRNSEKNPVIRSLSLHHPNFCRFRITDHDHQTDRMRERVQQMEWKQTLDAQLREKEAIKFRSAQEDISNEKKAQKGYPVWKDPYPISEKEIGSLGTSSRPIHSPNDPISWKHHRNSTTFLEEIYRPPGKVYADASNLTIPQKSESNMPPPAPSSTAYRLPNLPIQSPAKKHDDISPLATRREQAKDQVLMEYRQLLADIRNERAELRKEKEEIRWEREQICEERLMLQLENERVLSLLDKHADKNLNDSIHGFVPKKEPISTNKIMREKNLDDSPNSEKQKRQYPCWSPAAVAKINSYPSKSLNESTLSRKSSLKKTTSRFKIIESDMAEVQDNEVKSSQMRTKETHQRSYTPMTIEEFSTQAQISSITNSESTRPFRPQQFRLALQSPTSQAPSAQVSFHQEDQHCENDITEQPLTSESKLVPIADALTSGHVDDTQMLAEENILRNSHSQIPPALLHASGATEHLESRLKSSFLHYSDKNDQHDASRNNENHSRSHLSETETRAIKSKGFYNLNVDQSIPEEVFRRRSSVGFRSPFPSTSSTKHKHKEKATQRKEPFQKENDILSHIEPLEASALEQESTNFDSNGFHEDASINSKESSFFQVQVFHNES
uniref:Uncharacterized protein AlNc14C12G1457 n=1 Tax=Albugo laibachii Nc14 TaxID=890382 RepID=F0W379_9STRA|nr:conserved hypothetical protein [Albugo laibachii Nc14]|eukprot:CCA15520.1 conserved hypothetical protein [Albugo laibachii Nc14]